MQIKEFEAYTLKECLQQVRTAMGPDAVILETRKFRKGGLMGMGARDAVCIVAAVGITVQSDIANGHDSRPARTEKAPVQSTHRETARSQDGPAVSTVPAAPKPTAAAVAARSAYGRSAGARGDEREAPLPARAAAENLRPAPVAETRLPKAEEGSREADLLLKMAAARTKRTDQPEARSIAAATRLTVEPPARTPRSSAMPDNERFTLLERAMGEIRECLLSLQKEQRESSERTVTAVVSAVAPAISAVSAGLAGLASEPPHRFPEIFDRLINAGVSQELVQELFDQLPDLGAWGEQAQEPLALSALKDLIARRVTSHGGIELTPGRLKAVALIGPTGVGKTTTIAKLAANFALMQGKKVALLTVDTYRIAAVEQLKTYSQIIDLPIAVAYNNADVLPVLDRYADFDLILIDTAGRSQKNIMQVGELKSLLETVQCETHLVLSAQTKETDMIESARRFSAARVDRLIFSKLDETSSYGTLLNVADRTGIPLSYLTTGQKVPEDIENADGAKLASLVLD